MSVFIWQEEVKTQEKERAEGVFGTRIRTGVTSFKESREDESRKSIWKSKNEKGLFCFLVKAQSNKGLQSSLT